MSAPGGLVPGGMGCLLMGGAWSQGRWCLLPGGGGVCNPGVVCSQGGLDPGGICSWGVPGPGGDGVCSKGMVSQHALRQTPPLTE